MIRIEHVAGAAAWDAALARLPQPHILQSWAWGETKTQTGWHAKRLLWIETKPGSASASSGAVLHVAGRAPADEKTESGAEGERATGRPGSRPALRSLPAQFASESRQSAPAIPEAEAPLPPVAAAALLVRRLLPRLPLAVAYVPKGPLLDWSAAALADAALADAVLAALEHEARAAGALFLKIDPDVCSDTPEGQAVVALLARRGWRPSAEQIQFRNTMVSDLTPPEEALLAAMKPKWRYNIRLAERRGVVVRDGSPVDLPVFYRMYVETGSRDGFLVRPFAYYAAIWQRFLAGGLAHLLVAEVAGEPVAGLILFRFGPTAWYFYGASTGVSRDLMPNHALQWAAMRWAKAAGCTRYDWWGAPDVLDEKDALWGVYRFKQGFGGEFVPHIGAWDYPVNRPLYWAYTIAMPKALDILRRRHRAGERHAKLAGSRE